MPNPSKPVSLGAKACEVALDAPPDAIPLVILGALVVLILPLPVELPATPPLNALLMTLPVVAATLCPDPVDAEFTKAPTSAAAVATPP